MEIAKYRHFRAQTNRPYRHHHTRIHGCSINIIHAVNIINVSVKNHLPYMVKATKHGATRRVVKCSTLYLSSSSVGQQSSHTTMSELLKAH
jgi:hypothetical protein